MMLYKQHPAQNSFLDRKSKYNVNKNGVQKMASRQNDIVLCLIDENKMLLLVRYRNIISLVCLELN